MRFREYHLIEILKLFSLQEPLDLFLGRYFRAHKAIGSKDRKFISDAVYERIRWQGLFEHLGSFEKDPLSFLGKEEIPLHIRLSFPKELFILLQETLGEKEAYDFCLSSNRRASATIRVNLLKTSREALFERWKNVYEVSLCAHSPWGIVFRQKINFATLDEFRQGLFEVQDEASQLAAALVRAKPKESVLDYCAGAGGKTLAFAPQMQGKGQIYLHDIRPKALAEARKRLSRAGVQNAQFSLPKNKKSMDWVLADVPCSGTGTLRRNPDLKWKFSKAMLECLVAKQRAIFEEALQYLRPQGKIVYVTCSALADENERQASYFEKRFGLKMVEEFKSSIEEMDAFYAAVFS